MSNRKLLESDHFCILPFISSRIWHGAVVPCCINHETVFGNSITDSISDIYSNKNTELREFRKQLINGPELPTSCNRCAFTEKSGVNSYRIKSNKKWNQVIDEIEFDQEGNLTEFKIRLWDGIGYTNLCNLKCRMCPSYLSTTNRTEEVKYNLPIKQLAPAHQVPFKKFKDILTPTAILISSFDDNNKLYDFFTQHLDTTQEIKFEGGEPMMMEENYKLLELLIEHNKTDVALHYFTNMTQLTLKDYDILKLWSHFKNVQVHISLDAYKDQNYYIRHPSNWDDIVDNINRIRVECPHVTLKVNTAIQILNSFACTKLHKWCIDNNLEQDFTFLKQPANMSLNALTPEYKDRVKEHWDQYKLTVSNTSAIDNFLQMMYTEDTSENLTEFFATIKERDVVRNEDVFKTFPELIELKEQNDKRH
mgnify:CR=1 FL=1